MKRYKNLIFVIDGSALRTTPLKLPEDGSDCQCPNCLGTKWIDRFSVVQHGFDDDDCLDIVECETCHNVYHVQYVIAFNSERTL